MPRSSNRRNSSSYQGSFIKKALKWAVVAGLWCGIILTALCAWYAQELPYITKNAAFTKRVSITIKAIDGSVLARYGDMKGENVSAAELPHNLVNAVLAIEDRRFYYHWGIDFTGMARAMAVNILHGHLVQGGSTLTQQLAKNLFLSKERTFKRKIQEAMLALWLEHELTKDEILSAYMNRVYMGSGTYGVAAASKLYFNKNVKDLNLFECATLAGLLKAPSRYSPIENPGLSQQRANTVLASMADAGYITEDQAKAASAHPDLKPAAPRPSGADSTRYYGDWVIDSLQDLIGTPDEDIVVYTTMDPAIQKTAASALADAIAKNGKDRAISQGAVVVMRPDGAVLAMVGGVDYAKSQFNRAEQARRQPGSSFKPIVYLTALENGWSPQDVMLDAPVTEGKYRPKNYGGEYYGNVTLETALMLSLNTVTFRLIKAVGPEKVVNMAHRLGITEDLSPDLSLGLGTASLSPLDMVTAYSVLANGGMATRSFGITKITSAKGDLYYMRQPQEDAMRVVQPGYIQTLTMMMQNVIEYGTGQRAKLPWPAYGKTGTSQDSRDAWFIGFTPEIVTGVWMGNDDYSPMKKVTGGSFPADVWKQVMLTVRGKYPAGQYISSSPGYPANGNPPNPPMNYTASSDAAPPAPAADQNAGGFEGLMGRLAGQSNDAPPQPAPVMQGDNFTAPPPPEDAPIQPDGNPRPRPDKLPKVIHYND